MGRPLVLDASALLADIKDEPGAEAMRGIMREAADGLFMHAVNVSDEIIPLKRAILRPPNTFG